MLHCTPQNTPKYSASKWIHLPFLVDAEDFKGLFSTLGESIFLRSSGVYREEDVFISKGDFIEHFQRYVHDLQHGPILDAHYKPLFSLYWSRSESTLGLIDVGDGRVCSTQLLPNIVLQLHRFQYSLTDGQFRRQVFGPDTISWGLQASFPTLVQDPKTRAIQKVLLDPHCENRALWMQFQKWLKASTRPVSFEINGIRKTVPFRISPAALNWVDHHYELKEKSITVVA